MEWKDSLKGKKILVAEDDAVNIELMQDILAPSGAELTFATDGVEAVEKAKNIRFDLILMDIRMPEKDGIQATREIRMFENGGKTVPIFALTASTTESEMRELKPAGFQGMIAKPLDIALLKTTIHTTLGINH